MPCPERLLEHFWYSLTNKGFCSRESGFETVQISSGWLIRALLVLLTFSAAFLSHVGLVTLTRETSLLAKGQTKPVVLKPEVVKQFCLGHEQLAADIYWLRFIQYIGDGNSRITDKYESAYDYLNLVTTLDPRFTQPYWFAAFVVGSEMKRPDLAKALIERGIQANQNNWYLPFIAGVNQYLFAHNEVEAAKYYRQAAKFPDAPKWLGRQAEILQAKIPSLVKEVNTWDTIYRTSTDPLVKERAKERLAATWMRVFKVSPNEEIRKKARKALAELGVEVR